MATYPDGEDPPVYSDWRILRDGEVFLDFDGYTMEEAVEIWRRHCALNSEYRMRLQKAITYQIRRSGPLRLWRTIRDTR